MIRLIIAITCFVSVDLTAVADEAPRLAHNPFARPPSQVNSFEAGPLITTDSGDVTVQLNATMVGGKESLANVAGRIIRRGDEVDGFVLVSVYEDRAVFQKGGKRTTVYVKPELEEVNDP